jgi:hypothetical protein
MKGNPRLSGGSSRSKPAWDATQGVAPRRFFLFSVGNRASQIGGIVELGPGEDAREATNRTSRSLFFHHGVREGDRGTRSQTFAQSVKSRGDRWHDQIFTENGFGASAAFSPSHLLH